MNWLKRLPGHHPETPGLEWTLWRKLPMVLLTGTALLVLVVLAVHALVDTEGRPALARQLLMFDYFAIGALVLHWTAVFTVAIGCTVVLIMKGPAYEADPYPVPGPPLDP
jgi:hypothetical protein